MLLLVVVPVRDIGNRVAASVHNTVLRYKLQYAHGTPSLINSNYWLGVCSTHPKASITPLRLTDQSQQWQMHWVYNFLLILKLKLI